MPRNLIFFEHANCVLARVSRAIGKVYSSGGCEASSSIWNWLMVDMLTDLEGVGFDNDAFLYSGCVLFQKPAQPSYSANKHFISRASLTKTLARRYS